MKWTRRQKDAVHALMGKWRNALYVGAWNFTVRFHEADHPDGSEVLAEMTSSPEYMNATAEFYPSFLKEDDAGREVAVIHELCHVVVSPLMQAVSSLYRGRLVAPDAQKYAHELVTSQLERIVCTMAGVYPK